MGHLTCVGALVTVYVAFFSHFVFLASGETRVVKPGIKVPKASKLPCCLNFPPSDNYYYPDPVLDTLLFEKCPVAKTAKAICETAAIRYAKPGTSLYPVELKKDAVFISKPDEGPFWASRQFADVALVSTGCCFNVYPIVEPGIEYSAQCSNQLIGDPSLLSDLFSYSLMTAGSATLNDGNADLAVIIGGDWKGLTDFITTGQDFTLGGPFPGVGLFVGGTVVSSTGVITVEEPTRRLAGADPAGRIEDVNGVASFTPVSEAERLEAVATISSQVCALSKSMQALEPTGFVFLDAGTPALTIICRVLQTEVCVVNLDGTLFDNPPNNQIVVDSDVGAVVIKINVSGTAINQSGVSITTPSGTNNIIWNFFEADTIHITRDLDFYNSIVAPVARLVSVQADDVEGAILLGHPNSHFILVGDMIDTTASLMNVICPPPAANVTLCNCLCPADEY